MEKARQWLRKKARGTQQTGVLVTKVAARFKPLAVNILAQGDENAVHWFLEDKTDIRSSNYLEDAATEIQVQGLELDYTSLLWDADMRYENGQWQFYRFNGKDRWNKVEPITESKQEQIKYMLNAYRVLLTRARAGMIICVPEGNPHKTPTGFWEDETRLPEYYDGTYKYLKFEITARKGGGDGLTQFSRLTFLDTYGQAIAWPSGITWSSNVSTYENDPINQYSKFLGTNLPTITFTFPDNERFDLSTAINYCWYTANDQPVRDPVSWNMYVSNDGINWILIDARSNETITDTRDTVAFTSDGYNKLPTGISIKNVYYNDNDNWIKDDFGGGSSTLAGLTDTAITTPTNGQVLTYDAANDKWINAASGSGGVAASVIGPEETGATASQAYAVGDHFIRNDKFCTASASIASGATLTKDTNYTEGDVASALSSGGGGVNYYDYAVASPATANMRETLWAAFAASGFSKLARVDIVTDAGTNNENSKCFNIFQQNASSFIITMTTLYDYWDSYSNIKEETFLLRASNSGLNINVCKRNGAGDSLGTGVREGYNAMFPGSAYSTMTIRIWGV